MPLYEYRCQKCGNTFEKIEKFIDEPLKVHPECGGEVERLISAPALQFKGSGWYVNDYAKPGSGAPKESAKNGGSEGKSEGKSENKSDSNKSDSKKSDSGSSGGSSSSSSESGGGSSSSSSSTSASSSSTGGSSDSGKSKN